ncbi:MAG: hypothetical protein P4L33_04015 [Capsulimonadaceae bacterium]|nr:hypothetical protein [Capsulimonadaceae bacterium]
MTSVWKRANTDWLHEAKWGTMTHFLADAASSATPVELSVDDWNRRVDSVDVDRLADQIAGTGSAYHIFTTGQNSGFFCAPNDAYDDIVGKPSRLSQRDLLGELAAALRRHGVRTIAYMPSHGPAQQRQAIEALGFTPKWDMSATGIKPGSYLAAPDVDARLTKALRNWEAVLSEWSLKWGDDVSGWWFDGCYYADKLYRHEDAPNFRSFAEAAKAGNPESVVAFNMGVKQPIISSTEFEDYTPGELNDLWLGNKWAPQQRFIDGAQLHALNYLGAWWGEGPVRIESDLAIGFTRHVNRFGGAMTWDIPITKDGNIDPEFLPELSAIGRAIAR